MPESLSKHITPEGKIKLEDELENLWKVERPKVTQAVADAAAMGDRSENAEYIYGKKRLAEIDERIRWLNKRLDEVTVVEGPVDASKIHFGAWVRLKDQDGKIIDYRLVGPEDIDVKNNHISIKSPVGQALVGKAKGDTVTIRRPKGPVDVTVEDVNYKGF